MSLFDKIRNLFNKKDEIPELDEGMDIPYVETEGLDLPQIWALEDQNDFLIAMSDYLFRKSDCGENIDALSEAEQVFYICNEVAQEVNNGGFSQYLYNSSGDHAHRAVECMNSIGAKNTAKICENAFSAFGKIIPQNWEERQEFLDENETEKVSAKLEKCDDQFYDYPDDLDELCYQYIQANRAQFSQ